MKRVRRMPLALIVCLLASGPALAGEVIGAGSGSTGGMIDGKTNETKGGVQTGAATGGETVQDKQDKSGVGTGDNAVLNAPRETIPGTLPKSQPSNLNGQNAQP